jgi:hypothetical protein
MDSSSFLGTLCIMVISYSILNTQQENLHTYKQRFVKYCFINNSHNLKFFYSEIQYFCLIIQAVLKIPYNIHMTK